jgi:hypothetical protein
VSGEQGSFPVGSSRSWIKIELISADGRSFFGRRCAIVPPMMKIIGYFLLMVLAVVVGLLIWDALRGKKKREQIALGDARFDKRNRLGFKAIMEASPASV